MPRKLRKPATRGSPVEHPALSVLEGFLRSELAPEEVCAVVDHLIGGCARCQRWLIRNVGGLAQARSARRPVRAHRVYDQPIDNAVRRAFEATGLGTSELVAVREVPKLANDAAWVQRCIEEGIRHRHRDPRKMLTQMLAATLAAAQLDPADYLPGAVEDLRARAWAEQGNALRVVDAFEEAERCFLQALVCVEEGSGDPAVQARILELLASLRLNQGSFEEAFRLLDAVHELHLGRLDIHLAGRALVKKGVAKRTANAPEEAIALLERGIAWLKAGEDPELFLAAVHDLADAYVTAERYAEAARVIAEHRPLYKRIAEPLSLLRLHWVEAKIAAGTGDLAGAEWRLEAVRAAFAAKSLAYDAALSGLDLAALWLQMGRTGDIPALVREMLSTFRRLRIGREAIATLIVLHEAAALERATLALIRRIADRLTTLQRRPARTPGAG